ncbi:cytochrome c biogenesis CcdA family protein [Halohasta litorea]|uniref:Cytochrome c biogenesis CcdA family protein n=1 Tax=Halohasta litorea TaxID=869891 RepID=A0ABD6D4N8_9EURY|nr:cytochrome c biogenesis protein CcdA [Halohasta litorea]
MTGVGSIGLLSLAFSAGSATFFAPCAFPLLPGYLSYFLSDTASTAVDEGATEGRFIKRVQNPLARALFVSIAACLGMTLVYVGLAGTTVALGAGALTDIAVLELVVGSVFIVVGGAMALGWTLDRVHVRLPERRRSFGGFFAFGVLYAAAAAGCTAPLFIAVMARGLAAGPSLGVGLAVAYALGMSVVLVVLTVVSALGGSSVATRLSRHTGRIYRLSGGLLVLSGIAEIYYYFYGFPEVISV